MTGNESEYNDLCTTCVSLKICSDRTGFKRPVFFCEEFDDSVVIEILQKRTDKAGSLIAILEEIQNKYGYLPEKELRKVSEKTGCSLVDLYGIVTFYRFFRLKPKGRHQISVCLGTACHVRRGPIIKSEFERQLKIESGGMTPDGDFSLEHVNCLGACALGPIVVVDGHYFSNVNTGQVSKIITQARKGIDTVDINDQRVIPIEANCPRCNHSLMDPQFLIDEHPSIKVTMSFNGNHGWLRLSSLYGSYNIKSEYDIPKSTVVNFFCPHCHAELIGASSCAICNAPLVPMIIKGSGIIQVCSRKGCKSHMLDLNGVNI